MMNTRLTVLADGRVRIDAPAKLNLGLRVFAPRADGFHPIETWMVATSWCDTVTIVPGEERLKLVVTGRSQGVPTELDKNLVGKAALKLAELAGIPLTGTIELHKVVPPGGGLGGGSSDASAALVALTHAWGLRFDAGKLEEVAGQLGSDVPFFVKAQAALCTGRGEVMTPLFPRHALFAVLILPTEGCPTKDVYQAFDRLLTAGILTSSPTDWDRLAGMRAEELNDELVNDLEGAAYIVAPWLEELRNRADKAAEQSVMMTGSGSTLFTLASSSVKAEEVKGRLERALPREVGVVAVRIS